MANAISNTDNTIDSRDVIARIEELEETLAGDYVLDGAYSVEATDTIKKELITLKVLAEQGEKYAPDWGYGVQLIHEDYFEEAMDEMVANCYTLPEDLPGWMTITYDYDALKQDYTAIDFNGQTYYIR